MVNVSFNSDGTTQIVSGALGKKSEVYDFVYVEDIYTDDPASPDQSLQWNGSFISGTYLTLLAMKLEDGQETFGPAEVMMHVTPGDGEDLHANQASHFFDKNKCTTVNKVITGVDASGQPVTVSGLFEQCNAVSKGANGGTYLVADVNDRETLYAMPAPYPIAALTETMQHAVMVEDNTDYKNFSWRSSKDWAGNVLSYNLQSRIWENVNTKIDAKRHYFVSNDAVIPKSGITKIHSNSYREEGQIAAIDKNMAFYFGKQTNN
ncbi:MAG TPA: hypothetical protein PLO56_02585 [Rhodothermales bacterium]|nr:hypothetical protein [Rhodothermales bacterium]